MEGTVFVKVSVGWRIQRGHVGFQGMGAELLDVRGSALCQPLGTQNIASEHGPILSG